MGDYAKAETLSREAFEIRSRLARETSSWLPEARAISFMREQQVGRDPLLSVLRHLPETDHRDAYSAVWHTRGLVTRTLGLRRETLRGSPEAEEVYVQLRSVQQQMAQLTLAAPKPEQRKRRQRRLAELNDEKEQLERDLAKVSAEYRQIEEISTANPGDLAKALPLATALIDIIRATVWSPPTEGKGRMQSEPQYEAFVVRRAAAKDSHTDPGLQRADEESRVAWGPFGAGRADRRCHCPMAAGNQA